MNIALQFSAAYHVRMFEIMADPYNTDSTSSLQDTWNAPQSRQASRGHSYNVTLGGDDKFSWVNELRVIYLIQEGQS